MKKAFRLWNAFFSNLETAHRPVSTIPSYYLYTLCPILIGHDIPCPYIYDTLYLGAGTGTRPCLLVVYDRLPTNSWA